jgi:hypothetical protein
MNKLKLLLIILLLSTILVLFRSIFNKEHFNNSDQLLNDLGDMSQLSDNDQRKKLFESVENSFEKVGNTRNLSSSGSIDEDLLDLYVNNVINSDYGNPNKILVDSEENLPQAPNNDFGTYNHKMRMLIETKKVKQDYLVKVLRSKLELLLNKLGNVNEINYKIAKVVKFIPQTKNELQEALELLGRDKEAAIEKYGDFKTWDTSNVNFN